MWTCHKCSVNVYGDKCHLCGLAEGEEPPPQFGETLPTEKMQHPVTLGLISMSTFERTHARAGDLLASGASITDVIQALIKAGLDEYSTTFITHDAAPKASEWQSKPSNIAAVYIGILLLVVGAIVAGGNMTGAFPSILYLGFAIMGLGGLFIAGGRGRSG